MNSQTEESNVRTCSDCDGSGECQNCMGSGFVNVDGMMGGQENSDPAAREIRLRHRTELDGVFERRVVTSAALEMREASNGQLRFVGYASTTGKPYEVNGGIKGEYEETILRGAFKRSLGENPHVVLNINHGRGGSSLPLASTKSGTLRLSEDNRGLLAEADLDPRDPDVRALRPKVERGDVDEMSFAFLPSEQEWSRDGTKRTIRGVTLHRGDVSIVTAGANPDAGFTMRSRQTFLPDEAFDTSVEYAKAIRAKLPRTPTTAQLDRRRDFTSKQRDQAAKSSAVTL